MLIALETETQDTAMTYPVWAAVAIADGIGRVSGGRRYLRKWCVSRRVRGTEWCGCRAQAVCGPAGLSSAAWDRHVRERCLPRRVRGTERDGGGP